MRTIFFVSAIGALLIAVGTIAQRPALADDLPILLSQAILNGCNSHIDDRCFIYVGLRQ